MNYENVIPNLECAKLCTYYHNMHQIAALVPTFTPEPYTNFFVRKEYDDGVFPKALFAPNVSYSGRAFNPNRYAPLASQIEKTIPDMHIYDRYIYKYGSTQSELKQIKRILNCAHMRLSIDGHTPKTVNQLRNILDTKQYSGIIFHDYNLGEVDNAYDTIIALSNTRRYREKDEIRPYPIGNKFPIKVNSSKELNKWLKVNAMANIFFLQYNGLMDDSVLYSLCLENKRMARQVFYDITQCLSSEQEFTNYYAEKIFKQVLFMRRQFIKIRLIYDETLNLPMEIKNFIQLLNSWIRFSLNEQTVIFNQTLYNVCRNYEQQKFNYNDFTFRIIKIPIAEIRDLFQYFRINNYNLFKLFYECEEVKLQGGEFICV